MEREEYGPRSQEAAEEMKLRDPVPEREAECSLCESPLRASRDAVALAFSCRFIDLMQVFE